MNTEETVYDFPEIARKFDGILARGLCSGVGSRDGQMCVEAAICAVLDLPYGDDPQCVTSGVRSYKITLNDSLWSSATALAKGLRDLGIADFARLMSERTIRILIPDLFDRIFSANAACKAAAEECRKEGTAASAARADPDAYLLLSAEIALGVLRDLKSPGCAWLDSQKAA